MMQEEIATLKCKKNRMKKEMEELQRRLLKLRDDNRHVFGASALCDLHINGNVKCLEYI